MKLLNYLLAKRDQKVDVENWNLKIHRRRLYSFFTSLLAFIVIGALFLRLTAPSVQAAWFDDSWEYRKAINIPSHTSLETNVYVTVPAFDATDTTRYQSDCGNLRFTDSGGKLLQYYVVDCDSTANIHVFFDSLPAGSSNYYLYYGNLNAQNGFVSADFATAATGLGSQTAGSETQGPSPISYWSFDEGSASTAQDYTTQNNDLTITNAAVKTEDLCVSGKCLGFDGDADRATKSYSTDTEFLPGTGSFTVSAWFKHTSTAGADVLISRVDAVAGVGWKLYMNSSGFMCFGIDAVAGTFPNDDACTATSYADSQWHHVTAVKTGTTDIRIYIDASLLDTQTGITGTTLDGTNAPFTVGNDFDNGTNGWDGFIDEVKYYSFAKSTDQIKTDFASRGAVKGTSASFGPDTAKSLSQGLVGYWKMDETATPAVNSSGNTNNGTWTGNATNTAGKFGNAITLDGTGDYVTFADAATLRFDGSTQDFSLFAWIRRGATGSHYVVAKKDSTSDGYHMRFTSGSGALECQINSTNFASTTTITDTTTWHLVGCTFDRDGNGQAFVDGLPDGTPEALSSTSLATTATFDIGAFLAGPEYFNGAIDEARVYNRALSPAEVSALYNFAPGPIGHWKLDNNAGQTAADSSGNSFSGTLGDSASAAVNDPTWGTGKVGAGLNFDGDDDVVIVDDNSTLDIGTGSFTIEAWIIRNSSDSTDTIVHKYDNGVAGYSTSPGYQLIFYDTNELSIVVSTTAGTGFEAYTAQNAVSVGTWHHVAGVIDRTSTANSRIYIDGVDSTSVRSGTMVTGTAANAIAFNIGNACGDAGACVPVTGGINGFPGRIDDVKIYNYARTPKQVVEDMNAGHPAGGSPISSSVIRWKFDEQQGSTANSLGSDETLDGTATGTAWRLENSTSGGCKLNGCINIDTTTDDITRSDPSFFDSLTGLTAGFWLNPQTLATTRAIVSKSNTSQETFLIQTDATNSDELRVYIADTVTDTANYYTTNNADLTAAATYANWQHITVVYDATAAAADRIKVYKNGRLLSGSVTGTIPSDGLTASTANFQVGESHKATSGLLTYIDELKIYNFALSPSEILIDANAGSGAALGGVLGTHDSEGFGGNPPVGWWKMDDNGIDGQYFKDSSGYDFSGWLGSDDTVETEDPVWAPGRVGTSLLFDGDDDETNIDDGDHLDIGSGSLTITAWVRRTGDAAFQNPMGIVTKRNDGGGGAGYELYAEGTDAPCATSANGGDFLCLRVSDGADTYVISTDNTMDADSLWHHVAAVLDRTSSANSVIYIDGVVQPDNRTGTFASVGSLTNTVGVCIGKSGTTTACDSGTQNTFNGNIDDVRIYDYARTPAQIAYDYDRGAPKVWYKFDECSGTTAYNLTSDPYSDDIGLDGTITPGASGNTSVGSCGSGTGTEMWNDGTTGKFNSALGFDGADDYVTVTNASPIDQNEGLVYGLTASAWIYANGAGEGAGGRIFTKNTNTWCRTDTLSGSNLDIECSIDLATDAVLNVSTAITTASWHHVVMTWSNDADDEITIWVDGQNRGTSASGTPGSGDPSADTANLIIGNDSTSGTATFDGLIDDVRLYPYEMTAGQIQRLYNEGSAVRFGPQTGSP